jgi:hypothetical protein
VQQIAKIAPKESSVTPHPSAFHVRPKRTNLKTLNQAPNASVARLVGIKTKKVSRFAMIVVVLNPKIVVKKNIGSPTKETPTKPVVNFVRRVDFVVVQSKRMGYDHYLVGRDVRRTTQLSLGHVPLVAPVWAHQIHCLKTSSKTMGTIQLKKITMKRVALGIKKTVCFVPRVQKSSVIPAWATDVIVVPTLVTTEPLVLLVCCVEFLV